MTYSVAQSNVAAFGAIAFGSGGGSTPQTSSSVTRWWERYPSKPCDHDGFTEPPWDELVGPALREMPPDQLIELLGHLNAAYGSSPSPEAIWVGPTPEEAPYMQRIVTACMQDPGERCRFSSGSLIDYANRYMWNAIDAYRGTRSTRPATSAEQPGYEEQHPELEVDVDVDDQVELVPSASSPSRGGGIVFAALALALIVAVPASPSPRPRRR